MKILFDGMYSAFVTSASLAEGIASAKELEIDDYYYAQAEQFRKRSLEMLLLAEQVELTMCEPRINYRRLLESGFIKIRNFVRSPESEWYHKNKFVKDTRFINDWEFYRPLIIDHIQKGLPPQMKLNFKKRKVRISAFISLIMDSIIGKTVHYEQLKHGGYALWDCQPEGMKMYSWQRLLHDFMVEYIYSIGKYIIELLNYSFEEDCYLSSTLINRSTIKDLNQFSLSEVDSGRYNQSYDILTYSLKDLLGYLPKVETLTQVLKMREKKGPQIRALKDAVEEINLSFAGGKKEAIMKSVQLVKKAEKDLNRYQEISKINSWTTYISLPVAAAETLAGIFPVRGLGLGTIGVINTRLSDKLNAGNWIALYSG